MDIKTNRLYPYPILCYYNNDYIDSKFEATIEYKQEGAFYRLFINFMLDNSEISKMIDDEELIFLVHIESSTTHYRKIFTSFNKEFDISITESHLNSAVTVCFFIVANKNLSAFSNSKFHSDYIGVDFEISRGNIIAIARKANIYIDKERDSLAKTPSIFTVIRSMDLNEECVKVELERDKIIILMPDKIFKKYLSASLSLKLRPVIYSSIVLPALVSAFESVKNSNIDDFREYRWFRNIEKILKEKFSIDIDGDAINHKSAFVLSQLLLEKPIFDCLNNITQEDDE